MNNKKRPSKIADLVLSIVLTLLVVFIAIVIPFASVPPNFKWDFKAQANPTIMNGILTGTAIIFGFVTYDLRKIGRDSVEKIIISVSLLPFLIWTVDNYFVDAVTLGYPTVNTMLVATISFFYNIIYYFFMLLLFGTNSSSKELASKLEGK